jgi:RimJ/RimL family protein N-acetyltransferase
MERDGVRLRPIEMDDIGKLYEWHQDLELESLTGWMPRMSRARFERRYEDLVREPPEDLVLFGIEYDGRLVGYVELAEISRINRRAAIGFVVAERQVRRRGIGRTAVILMLDYAFALEDVDRVYAEVFSFNEPSLRLLEQVGFQREGRLRQHVVHQGRRQDVIMLGMLRDEFYARHGSVFPRPDALLNGEGDTSHGPE